MNKQNRNGVQAKQLGLSILNEVLEHRMAFYVLAAGATLMAVPASQAQVVFTPSNAVLNFYGCFNSATLQIDMNNDGTNDFTLNGSTYCYSGSGYGGSERLYMTGSGPNGIAGGAGTFNREATSLRQGFQIGNNSLSFGGIGYMQYYFSAEPAPSAGSSGQFYGNNELMGVRFQIDGKPHYGWIGFRSTPVGHATLFGWAYETQPNKPIRAGQRERADSGVDIGAERDSTAMRAPGPTSLELLAMGHTAIADRRRRISA